MAASSTPFPTDVRRIAVLAGLSGANGSGVDADWYAALIERRVVAPGVEVLVALADAPDTPHADFAARGGGQAPP
ncbi:hypothetical protein GCM10023209_15310 [Roseibacterium beibuensis]|uniref:Uncharacterized protein n=1 Tax=[Roseibacterium] beibuensis TaxID=1193142 RepID=A0ABP9L953_9RHOB